MVNLHKWLRRTSPHLIVAGTVLVSGMSGCRSASQTAVTLESGYAASEYTQAYPVAEPTSTGSSVAEPFIAEPNGVPYEEIEPESPVVVDSGSGSSSSILGKPEPPASTTEPGVGEAVVDNGPTVDEGTVPPVVPEPEEGNPGEPVAATTEPSADLLPNREELFPADVKKPEADSDSAPNLPDGLVNVEPRDEGADSKSTATSTVKRSTNGDEVKSVPDKGSDAGNTGVVVPPVTSFEPSSGNPEVPVPDPGKKVDPRKKEADDDSVDAAITVESPESSPITLPKLDVKESTKSDVGDGVSSLNENSKKATPLPKIDLPQVTPAPKRDAQVRKDRTELPTVTPGDFPKTTTKKNTVPQVVKKGADAGGVGAATELTTRPKQDQVASISKPEIPLPSASPSKVTPKVDTVITEPTKTVAPSESAIAVVTEVNGPIDSVTFDESGNAFVTHGQQISRIDRNGEVKVWARVGAPRGHVVLPDGNHIICDASQRAVVRLSANGDVLGKVATRSDGYFLRSPNDLIVDAQGGIYFTDPGYARIRNPIGKIHYVAPDGSVNVVAQRLAFPEGIALTPDGMSLMIVESQTNQVLKFEVLSPGRVGPKRVFAKLTDDNSKEPGGFANGMAIDGSGRVFVAHGGTQQVEVFSATGELVGTHQLNAGVSSVSFRQGDFSRVFAAGASRNGNTRGQLFEIRLPQ